MAPRQAVRIFSIQDRRSEGRARRWIVRWEVDGRRSGKSFPSKALAERFRSELLIARDRGEQFDRATGSPLAWAPSAADQTLWEWSRKWIAQQWEEWQPRTRFSITEALSRFVPLAVRDGAPDPPDGIRQYVALELVPGVPAPDRREPDQACDRWLTKWSRPLNELTPEHLATVEMQLSRGLDGQLLAPSTAARYRKVARSCVRRAVQLSRPGPGGPP